MIESRHRLMITSDAATHYKLNIKYKINNEKLKKREKRCDTSHPT